MYRWEIATAVACSVLGVNALDQPNVESSKKITKAKIADYQKRRTGRRETSLDR
jgi:transaldolase/glucose-6-phosphate isomerase